MNLFSFYEGKLITTIYILRILVVGFFCQKECAMYGYGHSGALKWVEYVATTEYTQSVIGHFLAYIPA
jgi:hypothetical protein